MNSSFFATDTNPSKKIDTDSNVQAYHAVLDSLLLSIASAQTNADKLSLVMKQLSIKALNKFANNELTLDQAINEKPEDKYYVTNALALAICLAKLDSVNKLLEFFNKDNINNPT